MYCLLNVALFVALVAFKVEFAVTEVRWCANGSISDDFSSSENATQYNDELYACMECPKEAKLVLLNELQRYECCNGSISPVGICPGEDVLHSCGPLTKCDGKKHCYDSSDEKGCRGCSSQSFGCQEVALDSPLCLPANKLCDSVKDCKDGEDETLCPYYGGWCDGYLCGGSHPKCLNYSQICDGVKDCMDGSDETNCQYCPNQFRCRVYYKEDIDTTSAECIGRFRVCNGVKDCINGADESQCHRWQGWSTWSECGVITEPCTRLRRRSCIDSLQVVVSSTLCYRNGSDFNENHIDICPECLDEPTTVGPSAAGYVEKGNDSTTPQSSPIQSGLNFDTGAVIGTAVGGGLAVIGVAFGIGLLVSRMKGRTGFWRPPSKLPRPSSSNLPGVGNPAGNRVAPEEISNPYSTSDDPKVADLDAPKEETTMSLRSVSASGVDSGIEDGVDTLRTAGSNFGNGLRNGVSSIGDSAVSGLRNGVSSIGDSAVSGLRNGVTAASESAAGGLRNGISGLRSVADDAARRAVEGFNIGRTLV